MHVEIYTKNYQVSRFFNLMIAKYTMYLVFSMFLHFPLCSGEYQSREKCTRVNLTQSCKSGKLKLSTWILLNIHLSKFNTLI